jgi:hypothetical protein
MNYKGEVPEIRGLFGNFEVELAEMYGPPSECKGKVSNEGKSASMYPAFRWRVFSWP